MHRLVYPRFCQLSEEPCRHLSLRAPTEAVPRLVGVTHPHGSRCDESEPTSGPAPLALLSLGQRSRLAAAIADDAGGLLPHPFTPHSIEIERVCSLLPACLTRPFPAGGPTSGFVG